MSTKADQLHSWYTDWMPAIGVDAVKAVFKVKAAGGNRDIVVQPIIQTAKVRTNDPDAPSLLGATALTGAGEASPNTIDISNATAGKQFVRFGMAYKAASTGGEAMADVSLQVCLKVYGKLVATKTLQLVAPDTSNYYTPITDWLPSMMVSKAKAALVVTQATGNFKVSLAYQKAATSVESPGSWSALGSLYGSGEDNTSDQTLSYGNPSEAWVRLGIRYTMDGEGTNGQGVVTASVGVRI